MPLPYMGSKRKSSGKIYQAIKNLNPESDTIVDLFCGGFAISECFLDNGWSIIANDKNKYIIAILKKAILERLDEAKCLEFVTRKMFQNAMANKDKYDDWYIGYLMSVYSFGNNQKGYLFGKKTDLYKRAGHELVVNKNPDLINKLAPNIPIKYIDGILKQDDWHKRRIALRKVSAAMQTRVLELEQLERLQRLEQLEPVKLTSLSYDQVDIPDNCVIYCDPPYKNTAEYVEGGFDHNKFWDWVREKSKTNNVYISEYQAPKDFRKILEFSQKSTLSGGRNTGQPNECLFTIIKS